MKIDVISIMNNLLLLSSHLVAWYTAIVGGLRPCRVS